MENLKSLFVDLIKIHLSSYERVSECMLQNTIQFYAEMKPFDTISIEEWYAICSDYAAKELGLNIVNK